MDRWGAAHCLATSALSLLAEGRCCRLVTEQHGMESMGEAPAGPLAAGAAAAETFDAPWSW